MTALSETEARRLSISKLQAVVGALSGIAAAHCQQAKALAAGFEAYSDTVSRSLAEALGSTPAREAADARGARAIVIFGAEHGFAGGFSSRLIDSADASPPDALFVLGARAISEARRRGAEPAWSAPMASHAAAVSATARRVADGLYEGFLAHRFSSAQVVYATTSGGAPYVVARKMILPPAFDAALRPPRGPQPLLNLKPERLLEALVGEHVFAELARAALESFASENAARLATMQSARFNIERKLDELTALERQLRQGEITAEVQEVVSGALSSEGFQLR